jgi:hypothetical protein
MPALRLCLAALIVVSAAATSSAAMAADSSPRLACAVAAAHLDPNHARVGQEVSFNWEIDNCSDHTGTLRFRWRLFGPCLDEGEQFRVTLDPGMGYGLFGFFAPTCSGLVKLRVKAFKKSLLLDRAGASVTVS